MHTQLGLSVFTFVLVALLGVGSCAKGRETPAEGKRVGNGTGTVQASVTLPPDGKPLYEFLMREEPQLMAEIPCVCCYEPLAECYQGLCPYS